MVADQCLPAAILESDTYDRALLLISAIDLSHHLSSLLPLLNPALRSNGSIDIQASDAALSSKSTLESAGWLNIQSSDPSSVRVPATLLNAAVNVDLVYIILGLDQLTATKPAPSASVPLRLKRPSANGGKKKSSIWATSPAPSTPTIEESSLLTPEDLKRRDVIQKPDCDVKRTRKACKDCTCGLREILLDEDSDLKALQAARASALPVQTDAKSGKQIVNTGAMSSSCGNCSLGDAFRCASCPYLGEFCLTHAHVAKNADFVTTKACRHSSQVRRLSWAQPHLVEMTCPRRHVLHCIPSHPKIFRLPAENEIRRHARPFLPVSKYSCKLCRQFIRW